MMSTMRTAEQQCALHLLDLCRVYPDHPARPAALAIVMEYRVRGAELRRLAAIRAAREAETGKALQLARRKLIRLIAKRGRQAAIAPAKSSQPRPRAAKAVAMKPFAM